MRVLLVDDEQVSLSKLTKIMSQYGDCLSVTSGRQALDAFVQAWQDWRPFDLICMDMSMPEMDGSETLLEIREMERGKKVSGRHMVKVLMVTAHADRDSIVTCIQAGCDDYLAKPFNMATIREKLERLGLA